MLDDLREVIQDQHELAVKAHSLVPTFVRLPGMAERFIAFDHRDGLLFDAADFKRAVIDAPMGPRRYHAHTLESLMALVNEFTGRLPPSATPTQADANDKAVRSACSKLFVFVSMEKVVAVLNEDDRRETVTFNLKRSSTWDRLGKLGAPMSQGGLISLLRCELDATYVPHNILQTVRAIKFRVDSEGESNIQVGKATVSKRIQGEITGAGEFPDEITITAPIWENVFHDDIPRTAAVRCCLDVDYAEQKFTLRPKAGQIEAHERDALEWLVGTIAAGVDGTNVCVYAGEP